MAARKKAAKKAARKNSAKKKADKKKASRKKRRSARTFADDLPKSLKELSRRLQRDINALEKKILTAQKDTRKKLTRTLRDASHKLGDLEARGQKEWRAMSKKARAEVDRTVKRVRRAAAKK
jgi:predicted transcriptional regulator